MPGVLVDINQDDWFSHEDRVAIFTMADKLAETVGIQHVKVSDTIATVFSRENAAGRERTQPCLEYRVVFNLDDETMVDIGEITLRFRFTRIGTCTWMSEPFTESDLNYGEPPEFLKPTLEQTPLFKNWFAQRQYIVGGISNLFQRIQRGVGNTLTDLNRRQPGEGR